MLSFRLASNQDLEACTQLLKDSFQGYPFFELYVTDPKKQAKFLAALHEVWMKTSFQNETVFMAEMDGAPVAVAVVKAPNNKQSTPWDYLHAGGWRVMLAGGLLSAARLMRTVQASDQACHNLPDPKWHLSMLAVSGACKGHGVGSRMLNECITPYIANHGGGLLTLNTNTEENRIFYRKNGFEEFDEMIFHGNGKQVGNWSYKKEICP